MLEIRGYVKAINDFVYNPVVDFKKGEFDTGLRETKGRATDIVCEDIDFLDLCINKQDKNGKKIYKNDIVNIINNLLDEEEGFFIVKYDIETARYILSGNSLVYDFDNIYANECEVIGNIYQNPELLREE